MCPGMRPATGWMANLTSVPRRVRRSENSRTLCCAGATAMPEPGTMMTSLAASNIMAASSAVPLRTGRSSISATAPAWTCPKAPNMMLRKFRFIALDMMSYSRKPDAPSRAPAMMRTLLFRTNPMAAPLNPAYEFNREMTVGMSAPPMGMITKTPKTSASDTNGQQRHIDHVLPPVDDRSARQDALELAKGHQAAGEGQAAQQDLEAERAHGEALDVGGL